MRKVLIADDEPWIAYGLIHLISWEDFGYTVCGLAQNGVEALEMCREQQPDLLLSDIRMPGLDGIALLEALRREEMNLFVVFVSGYSEFEYAQSAVRLGAFDYLLKPVEPQALTDLLERLSAALEKSSQQSYQESYYALLDSHSNVAVSQWVEATANHACLFLTFDCGEHGQDPLPPLPRSRQCIVLRTGREKYSALLMLSQNFRKDWSSLTAFLQGRHCGASLIGNGDSKLYQLYRQSDIAYCTALIGNLPGIVSYRQEEDEDVAEILREVQNLLHSGHPELCLHLIDRLEQFCAKGMMLNRVYRLHQELLSILRQAGYEGAEALQVQDYRQIISEYASIPALFAPCKALLAPDGRQAEPSEKELLEYVNQNFTNNIRIADIAEQFHFSPNYFSTFFRKKTGQTYVKYITGKRMALAKELLAHTELSIQEVADRTGYGDYYQFNRVFKKETQMAPSQYREEAKGS